MESLITSGNIKSQMKTFLSVNSLHSIAFFHAHTSLFKMNTFYLHVRLLFCNFQQSLGHIKHLKCNYEFAWSWPVMIVSLSYATQLKNIHICLPQQTAFAHWNMSGQWLVNWWNTRCSYTAILTCMYYGKTQSHIRSWKPCFQSLSHLQWNQTGPNPQDRLKIVLWMETH